MIYYDYRFSITEEGLKLVDIPDPDEKHQVRIKNTPLNAGDTFVLELDENDCMFFRRVKRKETYTGLNED